MITFMHLTEGNVYYKGNNQNLDVALPQPYFIYFQKYTPKRNVDIFNYSGTSEIPKPKKK
jgi:hypothetical protein